MLGMISDIQSFADVLGYNNQISGSGIIFDKSMFLFLDLAPNLSIYLNVLEFLFPNIAHIRTHFFFFLALFHELVKLGSISNSA